MDCILNNKENYENISKHFKTFQNISKHFKKIILCITLATTASLVYANEICSTTTSCHEGNCITVEVCVPGPTLPELPPIVIDKPKGGN
ncbi:hypothetical protein GCM10011501_00090 [Thalassotalea profundi]|uniref:Uncharacterized protein n=1 Tax=Thalassotalea profundi TaxID=2036687 RepID=A0ABQ3IE46_9GAMM|nr:hypothetical protein GCM10011501_00090 [Thalassotalea profundi]